MFAIVFGLSMDYEVFLVSRIHEEWGRQNDASAAIRDGLTETGRVITAAAAVMVVVFALLHLRRRAGDRALRARARERRLPRRARRSAASCSRPCSSCSAPGPGTSPAGSTAGCPDSRSSIRVPCRAANPPSSKPQNRRTGDARPRNTASATLSPPAGSTIVPCDVTSGAHATDADRLTRAEPVATDASVASDRPSAYIPGDRRRALAAGADAARRR